MAHENEQFSNGNYETRSSKLVHDCARIKMKNVELNLKGATVSYGLQPPGARLPKLV